MAKMLTNIHIQNFRCFEDFKAEGFERINLIGGKNNSGKTCLLEAILALRENHNRQTQLYDIALELRGEKIEDLIFQDLRIGKTVRGVISISGNKYNDKNSEYSYSTDINKDPQTAWLNSSLDIFYISQTKTFPRIDFDEMFYRIEREDRTDEFVEILKKLDSSIIKIRTIGSDGKIPQIKQKHNKNYHKLSSYGDATQSVLKYFTPIVERLVFTELVSKDFVLLIDEIENGIHYTAHYDFWKTIFKLSKELNVQVFSTTHSLEMITVFNKVALEQGGGAYFEMAREYENGKVFMEKHDTELLEYELENDRTIRGE